MVMERLSNNDFKRKNVPDKLQYLKDADDDNRNDHRAISNKLKLIIGILIFMSTTISGYIFDSIFLH